MSLPKVLIFTPIYEGKDYCLDRFLQKTDKISYPNKQHIFVDNSKDKTYYYKLKRKLQPRGYQVYHVERGNNSREALARSQNFARRKALEGNYSYMFSLESDIMVPPDIIQRLMMHGKRVITALYEIGNEDVKTVCITLPDWNENLQAYGTRLVRPDEAYQWYNAGLQQVQAGGFGTCLIHKSVFKQFTFTYDPRFQGFSDIYFFNQLFMKKIPVFVDTDLYCEHEYSDWEKVEDK